MNRNIKNIVAVAYLALVGTSAMAQVSQQKIGGNPMTINPDAVLELESSNRGLLLPRVALLATDDVTPLSNHIAGMTVYNTSEKGTGETAVTPGYYYNDGTKWVRIAVATALKAAMPKFFYMPSIIIPTSEEQMTASNSGAVSGDEFNNTTRQGTINLYGRYQTQFDTPMSSNTGATTNLPILPAAELDYHITWYDTSVFTSVTVTNEGLLNYTVSPTANITIGSFMNIVFAVKED